MVVRVRSRWTSDDEDDGDARAQELVGRGAQAAAEQRTRDLELAA